MVRHAVVLGDDVDEAVRMGWLSHAVDLFRGLSLISKQPETSRA